MDQIRNSHRRALPQAAHFDSSWPRCWSSPASSASCTAARRATSALSIPPWRRKTPPRVVQKLKESGVEYRLADNGATVLVPSEKLAESRLALAAAGLPKTGRIGFELFDKTNFRRHRVRRAHQLSARSRRRTRALRHEPGGSGAGARPSDASRKSRCFSISSSPPRPASW